MKTLREEIAGYRSDSNTDEYWARIHEAHPPKELLKAMSEALSACDEEQCVSVCNFIRDAVGPFKAEFMASKLVGQLEELAAGDDVRKANSAVFTLGRLASKKSARKLQAVLDGGKHSDHGLLRELRAVIATLKGA
ncbi:MAG: hypothetical protein HYZ75_18335 [Elusimicrobia bacterium]|nr:hypothetical protein [Elusimicrobiota bacterium]